METLRGNFFFLFNLDTDFKCLNDLSVNIVEANANFDVELLYYARCHLSDFLVNLDEVEINYEGSFGIFQTHLFKLFEHYSYQQIIRLVNLE